MDYCTVLLKNIDLNIKEVKECIKYLLSKKYKLWFIFKNNELRLRILKKTKNEILDIMQNMLKNFSFEILTYEPECFLFVTVDMTLIHSILHEFSKISMLILEEEKKLDVKILILNYIVNNIKLDLFEKWDVWCNVRKYRSIPKDAYKKIVFSNIFNMDKVLSSDLNLNIYGKSVKIIIENFNDIYTLHRTGKLSRGFRNIVAAVLIFSMNILCMSLEEQLGTVNLLTYLKNPDVVKEFY